MKNTAKTMELFQSAMEVMPGVHSILWVPLTARPLSCTRGKGARVWDVNGNDYLDYLNGITRFEKMSLYGY